VFKEQNMKNDFQIDSLDRKILSILTKDARLGIISGSQFNVDPKKMGFKTCAFVGIFLDNAALFNNVSEKLLKIQEITQCHYITGQYAMFVEVYARDNEHLRVVLADKIQAIKGVSRTETFISLDILIDRQLPVMEDQE
jgi:Lrp/AsnC family transcriptional regulator for asnA, asnC and gidA